jgi:hypothetical protein
MPRAKQSPVVTQEKKPDYGPNSVQPRKSSPKAEWMSFVPCELREADKPAFLLWYGGDDRVIFRLLDECIAEGLKFALTFDVRNNCYVASISGRPSPTLDWDWNATLTGRGGTIPEAMAVLFYKHTVLLSGDWFERLNNKPSGQFTFG